MRAMKRLLIVFSMLAIVCACIVGCSNEQLRGELKILSSEVRTHEFTGGMPQSTATVMGRAQNVGNALIGVAQIAVEFYDANGRLIGTASTAKDNLKVGEEWQFSAQIVGPDAWKSVKYKIAASVK